QRVRGRDPTPVVRIVDDRREEVGREDQRGVAVEPYGRRVVAGGGAAGGAVRPPRRRRGRGRRGAPRRTAPEWSGDRRPSVRARPAVSCRHSHRRARTGSSGTSWVWPHGPPSGGWSPPMLYSL